MAGHVLVSLLVKSIGPILALWFRLRIQLTNWLKMPLEQPLSFAPPPLFLLFLVHHQQHLFLLFFVLLFVLLVPIKVSLCQGIALPFGVDFSFLFRVYSIHIHSARYIHIRKPPHPLKPTGPHFLDGDSFSREL